MFIMHAQARCAYTDSRLGTSLARLPMNARTCRHTRHLLHGSIDTVTVV